MKLATLGMRNIAVNLLWSKTLYYHKVKDFTSMSATLEQIAKLQPNFVRVWVFQGWNLSYNVSVEFDDYRDRYHWVIRGIRFIQKGTQYNKDEPVLLREIGRTISQKIGTADEHVIFRKLFKADDDFHGSRPIGERDNWLVGKEWFKRAEQAVETTGRRMRSGTAGEGASQVIYCSEAPLCQIHYADALESEGIFDEAARAAWQDAQRDWEEYGSRDLEVVTGKKVRLENYEYYIADHERLERHLVELAPGVRETIAAEKAAHIDKEERDAYEKPTLQRDQEQQQLYFKVVNKLLVSPIEIANRVAPGPQREDAIRTAAEMLRAEDAVMGLDQSRTIVNYGYWKSRCRVEQSKNALAARKLFYQATQAQEVDVDLEGAKKAFEEGFQKWRLVLDEFPSLIEDGITGEDIVFIVRNYRLCLKQLDEQFPKPFILDDLLKIHDQTQFATPAKSTEDAKAEGAGAEAPAKVENQPGS